MDLLYNISLETQWALPRRSTFRPNSAFFRIASAPCMKLYITFIVNLYNNYLLAGWWKLVALLSDGGAHWILGSVDGHRAGFTDNRPWGSFPKDMRSPGWSTCFPVSCRGAHRRTEESPVAEHFNSDWTCSFGHDRHGDRSNIQPRPMPPQDTGKQTNM